MTTATVNTIKAAQRGEEYRVEGYLVRFTDANDPDLHGEYFDKRTYFWEKERPIKGIPILIDHAFDSRFKGLPVGIVDFVKEDEIGKWIEGKLHEREEYIEYLQHMRQKGVIDIDESQLPRLATNISKAVKAYFDTGQVQWSSGAHPQLVEVDESDGHIKSWAFIEATAVMTPAEPEGTEIRSVKKALDAIDNLLQSIPTATATKEANKESKGSDADNVERGGGNTRKPQNLTENEDNIMNMDAVREFFRMMLDEIDERMLPEEEEVARMEDEIVEEVTRNEDEFIEEKQENGELEEEKQANGEEEEAVNGKSINYSKLANLFDRKIKAYESRQRKAEAAKRDALRNWKANRPAQAQDFLPNASGKSNGALGQNGRQHANVSVAEARKFAPLSGADMALGLKYLLAGIPSVQRNRATIGDLVGDDYARVMANKMAAELDLKSFSDPVAASNLKAVLPFRSMKADELNASDITAQGLEWVTTYYDETLWERVREQTEVFNLLSSRGLRVVDIPQGAQSVQIQTDTASGNVFYRAEANDLTASDLPEVTGRITNFGTGKKTLTAKEHVLAYFVTDVLNEDSIIPALSHATDDMVTTMAEAIEDALINGDTTSDTSNINHDGAALEAAPERELWRSWDGLRHEFLIDNTAYGADHSTAALVAATFLDTRNLLDGKIRQRRKQLLYIIDYGSEAKARQIAELFTRDVAYNDATFFTGILPPIDGVEVYTSGFLRSADTDGKVTDGGNVTDTGTIICVYAPYWAYARKRAISTETARGEIGALAGGTTLVTTVRHDFAARGAGAASGTYNIAIA